MFGFITPNLETLNKEEKTRYQNIYCGLCHSLRDNYNNIARLALTYDLTFLVLLLSSLYEPKEKTHLCNCLFHPGTKYNATQNIYSDYCADLTVILAYHKLKDDIIDENKIKAKVAASALNKQYQKVEKKLPEICSYTNWTMQQINILENTKKLDLYDTGDKISKLFGSILAKMFAPHDDIWAPTLAKLGADLGRFIYFMDAAIDLEKDKKNNSYNPYLNMNPPTKDNLMVLAGYATESFEKLPLEQDLHLLKNILYEGMWANYNKAMGDQNNKN